MPTAVPGSQDLACVDRGVEDFAPQEERVMVRFVKQRGKYVDNQVIEQLTGQEPQQKAMAAAD